VVSRDLVVRIRVVAEAVEKVVLDRVVGLRPVDQQVYIWYDICMKTITIHVSEDTYTTFQDRAKEREASASELIREAMSEYAARHFSTGASVFDHAPAGAGEMIRPLERDDDLLEEMLG